MIFSLLYQAVLHVYPLSVSISQMDAAFLAHQHSAVVLLTL